LREIWFKTRSFCVREEEGEDTFLAIETATWAAWTAVWAAERTSFSTIEKEGREEEGRFRIIRVAEEGREEEGKEEEGIAEELL
jgi:hypothetical protein